MAQARTQALPASSGAEDTGKLLLRVGLGVLILLHGIAKISSGPGWIVGMLEKSGMPGFLAYAVYIGEVLAPLLLIVGVYARAAGIIIVLNMLVAIVMVHIPELGKIVPETGGWALELQGMFILAGLTVALIGAGRYSLGGIDGRWN